MNARLDMMNHDNGPAPLADCLRNAAASILRGPTFAKAPRMRQLLAFLIDAELTGSAGQLSEYAIGLAVFRRDPRVYDTTLDPVVRVQTGRLRERLAAHYRAAGAPDGLEISIPNGGYALRIAAPAVAPGGGVRLQLAPLRDLSRVRGSDAFVWGLDDELCARLYRAFGEAVTLGGGGVADYRLEGGIRVEGRRVRACVRLVDEGAAVAWMSQFDGDGDLGMALQEELAGAICDGLRRHLDGEA
nr:hypothetical protein [uncultured Duganella sp.]